MFKNTNKNKSLSQQRAVLKPMKNIAIYEEDEEDIEDDSLMDDESSNYSNGANALTSDTRNDTMLLAQFLATTGPEEYEEVDDKKKRQQFKRASRLLSRLRKRPSINVTTETVKPYIPLPAYEIMNDNNKHKPNDQNIKSTTSSNPQFKKQSQPSTSSVLRDSGIYSETNSEKDANRTSTSTAYDAIPSPPPLPHFSSVLYEFPQPPTSHILNTIATPRRPPPLPPTIASAAIVSACSPTFVNTENTTNSIRSVPEAALKRRSVRLRHVQVQTSQELEEKQQINTDKQACPHCRQVITNDLRSKRTSCPPALASGPALLTANEIEDSKVLLAMIMKLKSQLEEEKQCRIKLEKAMQQQQQQHKAVEKKEQLAKERDKWADDCSWLNDRIAFLPE